jgi:hypothetical protein
VSHDEGQYSVDLAAPDPFDRMQIGPIGTFCVRPDGDIWHCGPKHRIIASVLRVPNESRP